MTEVQNRGFLKFGLLVTGEGEAMFLPLLFRSIMALGNCRFEVIRQIGQLSPRTSPKHARRLQVTGTQKGIPSRDEEAGLAARGWLDRGGDYVLLVDDLEHDRRAAEREIFGRYRQALDTILRERRNRASVHFLVNMLEAYYFADTRAPNVVLKTALKDHSGDVEELRHPKNDLKREAPGFDEKKHGQQIVQRLDLEHVLSNPEACSSLRVLFAWCMQALGLDVTDRYRLDTGIYAVVTGRQLAALPSPS